MIKPHELRIGNYVYDDEQIIVKIECLRSKEFNDWNGVDDYEIQFSKDGDLCWSGPCFGIPLTEDWMLKFGFEPCYEGVTGEHPWASFKKDGIEISLPYFEFTFSEGDFVATLKSVHQLQNLFFALTGEELEFKTT